MTRHHGATPLEESRQFAKWVTLNILRKIPQKAEVLWIFASNEPAKVRSLGQGVTRIQGVGNPPERPDAENSLAVQQMPFPNFCQVTQRWFGRGPACRKTVFCEQGGRGPVIRPRGAGGPRLSRRRQLEAAANRPPEPGPVLRVSRETQCRGGQARSRLPSSERR